jgi:hypothetical protein
VLAFRFIFGGTLPIDFAHTRSGGLVGGVAEATAGLVSATCGLCCFRLCAAVAATRMLMMVVPVGPNAMNG